MIPASDSLLPKTPPLCFVGYESNHVLVVTSIFRCAGYVIVRGEQLLSPPDYQAPVVKASECGNERQKRSDRRKVGGKGKWKKMS